MNFKVLLKRVESNNLNLENCVYKFMIEKNCPDVQKLNIKISNIPVNHEYFWYEFWIFSLTILKYY